MCKSIAVIALGAALGALLRWQLVQRLNAFFPSLPPGTLIANMIGAYIAGFCAAFLSFALAPEWRLFAITGFCGGLTTFSTFSLEIADSLQRGKIALAFCAVASHVAGSVLMIFAGIDTAHFLKNTS
ncbi:MAG: fluoride efflux transporter CrcB [Candidatus Accumulibacter sp.]|jgi:CrcB protein|nr:fluoride efflux transporter CrcB [Accumulibacter sp.]